MSTQKLWHFHGGLRLDGHKQESMHMESAEIPIPSRLILPLQQHIGAAAEPVVQVGDKVLKGQCIAEAQGGVSVPLHAPSSGTIEDIALHPVPHPSGMPAMCITIKTDGKDEWLAQREENSQYHLLSPKQLRSIIHHAGIVGLGGAGFPTYLKLHPGQGKLIKTLILNGAECEPYITCDAMLMQQQPRDVLDGANIMRQAVQAAHCVIGIEDNKPAAIEALRHALRDEERDYIDIVSIPTLYPSGGEKQLITILTGKEIPSHKLPIDIDIVCHNVGTAKAVADAVIHGKPLLSRYVTITGKAVANPHNCEVLLGTPIAFVLQQAELQADEMARLVMGGPMMGFQINDLQTPVIKTTNCLLTLNQQDIAEEQPALACIRCGECARVCPAQLLPQQLYWWAKAKDFDKVQDYKLFDCIECGCCAYVCPSHIPLVQYYRFAKTEIWQQEQDKRKSDHARERHEFHQYRIELKKKEDEERRRKKKELLKKSQADTAGSKQGEIEAALARVQAKKGQQETAPEKNIENLSPAQQQQVAEAEARRARSKENDNAKIEDNS